MVRARKGLDKIIQEWMDHLEGDETPVRLTAIALMHMEGMQGKEVHTTRFSAKNNTQTAKQLGDLFMDKANAYAQDLIGPQTFNLLAYYGKNEETTRHPFLVQPVGNPHGGALSTEAPTEAGMRQQSMRHTEMVLTQMLRKQEHLDQTLMTLSTTLARENQQLRVESFQNAELVMKMMVDRLQAENNFVMQQLNFQRDTMQREKLMSFAPALVNSITGKDVFPQAATDTALIEAIGDKVTPEMLNMLSAFIPAEAMGVLTARLEQIWAKKEKAKQLPKYSGNPIDDVTGGPRADLNGTTEGGGNDHH